MSYGLGNVLRGLAVRNWDEPIAGGRHKVWGSKPLWVLPQTSTIASHLPKALGTAVAIGSFFANLGIDRTQGGDQTGDAVPDSEKLADERPTDDDADTGGTSR